MSVTIRIVHHLDADHDQHHAPVRLVAMDAAGVLRVAPSAFTTEADAELSLELDLEPCFWPEVPA